ncbi:sulfotransferase family 2 domain-containing protein [Peribacillus simplex]|uniref:sulfotransferase family 2 domain-containing protein n=1 Tax=Peribacillus simplex TaxID=1478 RepID=UPI0016268267|nr:sulfotransferase family 2 domain-containing protein [Peribacillus simplex]
MKEHKNDDLLIFLHIQKTAGSSLRTFVKKQYEEGETWFGRTLEDLKDIEKDKYQCLGGHFPYGIHENFSRPYSYFTMLREPIDRVISYYSFIQNKETHGKHDRSVGMDLKSFMKTFDSKTENFQTRRITGGKPNLEKAKEHLLRDFSFVGLTERFEESLYLMKKEYQWPTFSYKNRNITKTRLDKSEIPEKITSYIAERNELDIELYRFAGELFEAKLDSLTSQEKVEMNDFLERANELDKK